MTLTYSSIRQLFLNSNHLVLISAPFFSCLILYTYLGLQSGLIASLSLFASFFLGFSAITLHFHTQSHESPFAEGTLAFPNSKLCFLSPELSLEFVKMAGCLLIAGLITSIASQFWPGVVNNFLPLITICTFSVVWLRWARRDFLHDATLLLKKLFALHSKTHVCDFSEVLLADILTSLVKPMANLMHSQSNSATLLLVSVPLIIRIGQCYVDMRHSALPQDPRNTFSPNAINITKYLLLMISSAVSTINPVGKLYWVLIPIITQILAFYWDLHWDWGLDGTLNDARDDSLGSIDKQSRRSRTGLRWSMLPWVGLNLIIRLAMAVNTLLPAFPSSTITFLCNGLEIYRRLIWTHFRIRHHLSGLN